MENLFGPVVFPLFKPVLISCTEQLQNVRTTITGLMCTRHCRGCGGLESGVEMERESDLHQLLKSRMEKNLHEGEWGLLGRQS